MDRIFVWLMRLILSLAVIGAVFFSFGWYVLSRSLPDYTKTVQFEQLIAPVEIVRDTANVPHIFGKNDHAAPHGAGAAVGAFWRGHSVYRHDDAPVGDL